MKSNYPINICTFGCAKNEVDSRDIANDLQRAGFSLCDNPDDASLIIINTCAFIREAVEENLEFIFAALKNKKQVIVSGCLPSRYGQELHKLIPEVFSFVPCAQQNQIVDVVQQAYQQSMPGPGIKNYVEPVPKSAYSYIKIAEGCSRNCSFCTIPSIRGKYKSTSMEDILKSSHRQVETGANELVLVAQDTGIWGRDLPEKPDLSDLLKSLALKFPETWIRVLYIQPE
ncbi:MAG: hypothetical protein HUJ63_05355, partial [Enterococcus sp.]|nr:hypothetical protein [Enterococcus sp.]